MTGSSEGAGGRVEVFAVRHGETVWNREGRIQGFGDSALTGLGLAQARAVARRLSRERIDALHSSDLERARLTAGHVAAESGLEVTLDAGLRERSYGVLEGMTREEIEAEHPESARRLGADPEYVIPGGESLVQFRDRVMSTLERILAGAEGGAVAIVTHGGVLGILYRAATGLPLDARLTCPAVNASVTRLRHAAGRWELVRWSDADHLAPGGAGDGGGARAGVEGDRRHDPTP